MHSMTVQSPTSSSVTTLITQPLQHQTFEMRLKLFQHPGRGAWLSAVGVLLATAILYPEGTSYFASPIFDKFY